MDMSNKDTDSDVSEFRRKHSPEGNLDRYVTGRLRFFFMRQILTIGGAVALGFMVSVPVGLLVALLAVGGEVFDSIMLLQVPRLRRMGMTAKSLVRFTAGVAIIQAMGIAAAAIVTQLTAAPGEATFFIMAILTGASMNAGLSLHQNAPANFARIAVYAAVVPITLGIDLWQSGQFLQRHGYHLMGVAMMSYMVYLFIRQSLKNSLKHKRNRHALLLGKQAVDRANFEMGQKQKELHRLSMVAQHAHDSVVMSGPDLRVIWVNDAFTRITGYSFDEVIGKNPGELLNGPDTDMTTVREIGAGIQAKRAVNVELVNYTKQGRKIWVQSHLAPVIDDNGEVEVVIAIERDVTQFKLQARQLAEAKLAAEKGARAKADFLATMSHEIRTPLNGIIGMSDLLATGALEDQEKLYADTIQSSAYALLKIINDILDISKLDAGKMAIESAPFSAADCIRDAVALLRTGAQKKSLFLDVCFDTKLPNQMMGDDGRTRQILLNLIGNAIKFTETGGITIRSSHVTSKGQHELQIRVKDTGVGIPPDRLSDIFGQFEQADAATNRKFGGTGLGLSISRQLARRMGGDLTVTSTQGQGSEFTLKLRADVATTTPKPATPARAAKKIEQVLQPMTVLVAEDNKTNQLLIRSMLKSYPLTLKFADNGHQAVDAVQQEMPDVILMDMSMPKMDGLEATRQIRAAGHADLHIIALTANAFESNRQACFDAGMNDFLTKPVSRNDLTAALAKTYA